MDLFEHRYYRLNKMFLKFFGAWPYQSARVRFVMSAVILAFGASHMIPQILAVMENLEDWDLLMECVESLLFVAFCIIKFLAAIINTRKMIMLLNHIRKDWEVLAQDRDVHILHEYAQKGIKITRVYAVVSYTTCTLFVIQPIVRKIMDTLLKNGTEPGQFPLPINYYYIDMQKYYFYIVLHAYVYTSLGFIFSISYKCWFMMSVQHGCGLFALLGRKLQRIGRNERSPETGGITDALDNSKADLEHIRSCIDRHHDAIEYAELIEAAYSWCFFALLGINMLMISTTGLQIVKKTMDRQETLRFIPFNIIIILHLYVDNFMAQILMDHSISIRSYIHNGEWYKLPTKIQKLLLLMLMRCTVPCKLTAGHFFSLSLETFVVFLKTSLSYFTLLRAT